MASIALWTNRLALKAISHAISQSNTENWLCAGADVASVTARRQRDITIDTRRLVNVRYRHSLSCAAIARAMTPPTRSFRRSRVSHEENERGAPEGLTWRIP
jgi:hypothetical protein